VRVASKRPGAVLYIEISQSISASGKAEQSLSPSYVAHRAPATAGCTVELTSIQKWQLVRFHVAAQQP